MTDCPFCDIVASDSFQITNEQRDVVAFQPLNPVTPGHLLVVPRQHVADASEDPYVTSITAAFASIIMRKREQDYNLITSVGEAATQTIRHLHFHIVPRRLDDGLTLPWTGQVK